MKRDEVLATAGDYINGQRAEDYGDAYENFERIAEGWNTIIRNQPTTSRSDKWVIVYARDILYRLSFPICYSLHQLH